MTFEQLANQLIEIQKRKNADYGSSFDQTLDEFGLVASAILLLVSKPFVKL